ncbi:MAG: hypothetical protein A3I75_00600 [Deltaproteobacteria bacterium RIFCSPLOWO2_02_FULL_50_16]|nr:MAG: hypothetical protein A3I75_00600 [Deltaproteobacteria bacterium RIFCSPLOWO2_02_FULL_50_16]
MMQKIQGQDYDHVGNELKLFRHLINQSNDAIFVIDPKTAQFLDVNEKACQNLGYSREALLNMKVIDIQVIIPNRFVWKEIVASVQKENNAKIIEGFHKRRDGTTFPVEVSVKYILEGSGNYLVAVARDLTNRKKMEENLKISDERFRLITENIHEVFWITSADGEKMHYVSPGFEKIWGHTCKKLYENPKLWFESIHPDEREEVGKAFFGVAQIPKGTCTHVHEKWLFEEEYRIVRPDGKIRWIRDRGFPVVDAQGQVYRIAGIAEDITEQKQINERLRHASKMEALGQFAAGAAHEINNPLTIIAAHAQYLCEKLGRHETTSLSSTDYQELLHGLDIIQKSALNCGGITADLLSFSRKGRQTRKIAIDLNDILQASLVLLKHQIKISHVTIVTRLPIPSRVLADPDQFKQVFINILMNAVQAMPQGGEIHICNYETQEGEIAFDIRDQGVGIDPAHLDCVMEPFFTTKDPGKGSGLGLSVCYSVLEEHGGKIRLESEVGKGTTVTLTLPPRPVRSRFNV